MGDPVQKTLQRGRGKEKGTYYFLIPALLGICISAQVVLLFFDISGKNLYMYAVISFIAVGLLVLAHIKGIIKGPVVGLVYGQTILEGVVQVLPEAGPLHLGHYPVVALSALILKGRIFWAFILFQPLLHLREITGVQASQTITFLATLFFVGPAVYLYVVRLRAEEERYRKAYNDLIEKAETVVGSEALDRKAIVRRYLSETELLRADLRDVAETISRALLADRTTIFLFERGNLLPAVSDGDALPEMKPSGLLHESIKQKMTRLVVLENPSEKINAGFTTMQGVMTLLFCPVLDGNVPVGGITTESLRYRAFEEREARLLEALSVQVAQLLKKHRLLSTMGIEHELLQGLQKESERLVQKLQLQEVTEAVKEGVISISGAEYVFVLLKDKKGYLLMDNDKNNRISLRGTMLEDIAVNRQPFYFRDVKQFKKRPLPFDCHGIRSFAGFPLLSGRSVMGMVVLASSQPEAFTERLLSIIHLYCNQASESISRALLYEDTKKKALTDGLTGLYNHRHFQERLEENIKRAERLKEVLSLMLLDIDHFKKINDTYGHPVGDQVLRGLASLIGETVREIDLPARYGGEEFGVLLLGANKKEAQQIAERLRKRVKDMRFRSSSGDFSITVSIGIATFPEDATTREELIEKADGALYMAKNSGRDRVVLA